MAGALHLQAIVLTVPDLAQVEKFYRWVLAMRAVAGESTGTSTSLGWEGEDRIVLEDAGAAGAEEALTLRLPQMTADELSMWLNERSLESEPAHPRPGGGVTVTIRGTRDPRIDLFVPSADQRSQTGPPVAGHGLEIPGLLGVTTGTTDPARMRSLLSRLGIEALDPEAPEGPLRVGDQQWMLERREPAGIYGLAVVVKASRVKDLARTLEKLGAQYRHDGNRIVALDPAGRVLLVHGLKGG